MWQAQAQTRAEDLRLDSERRLTCRGSALVRFEYLRWKQKRTPDEKHVEALKKIFKKDGCRPLEVQHHIPVIIDQKHLDTAWEDARQKHSWQTNTLPSSYSTVNSQGEYLELEFPGGLEYLHGCHRIEAGRQWLTPSEKWWIVDLYLSDISYELRTFLAEEYANEEKPCDGEIYRKIRFYKALATNVDSMVSSATCHSLEMRWWARLKGRRADYLKSMLEISRLAASFDALSRITGLCDSGMKITTLHKVRALRCYDVRNYLESIEVTFDEFFKGISQWRQRVNKVDVKVIELRAPGVSTVDAEFLQPQILGGVIFKDFSPQERMIIWDNIRVFKGIIPSLFTFFQDIILLEACIDGVKRLVTVAPNQTVFTALDGLFESNIESQWIQTSETTFASERGSRTACKTLGILGLLAFAMRMYVSLPKDPVKQNRKAKPRAKADQGVLQRLGALASHLGCKSPKIEELMKLPVPPIIQDAQEFVPLLVTTGPGVNIEDRLGFPHEDNFKDDMKYLFLHNLCEDRVETGEGITSFFVLKSWFTAFFKPPQWSRPIVTAESPNPPSVPQVSDERVEEDVDMEQPRPQSPVNQELEQQQEVAQVRQSIQFSEPVQETVEPAHEGLSGHAVEVNQRFEMEQEVETSLGQLPALHEAVTQNQAIKVADSVIINFVKGNINESYIPERIDGCELVQKLRVDSGDPNSLVEQAVRQYIQNGVRTRDKFKRYLAPNIKSQERVRELEAQALQAGRKETERLREQTYQRVLTQAEDSTMAVQQIREEEDSTMAVQQIREEEDSTMAMQQTQEEEDNTMALSDNELLNHEKDNAANSHILKQQIVIYFKQRVGNSDDTSKSAKAWEWTDLEAMQVPVGDPHNEVQERAKLLWHYRHLRPHNEHLKILQDKDCYKAAEDDTHHTLYLMLDSPSKRPPLRPRRPRDKKPYERPPSAPQPRPPRIDGKAKEQVESSEMDHMDQRVRGPDQPDKEPTKFGWTDKKDSSPQIRKGGKIRKERNQGGSAAPTGSQPTLEAPPGPDPTESAASIAQAPTSQDALPDMTSIL